MFEHPFDLCKVRLQSQVLDQMTRFSGPIDCLTKTWKNEGFRGLYRVCSSPHMRSSAHVFLHHGDTPRSDGTHVSLFFPLSSAVGFTSTNRRGDGREFVPVPIVQRAPEPDSMGEPNTTGPRSKPTTTDRCCRRRRCAYELCLVRSFRLLLGGFSEGKFGAHRPSVSARTPIELVKCKMQVQMLVAPPPSVSPIPAVQFSGSAPLNTSRLSRLPGPIAVLKTVIRTTGFRGLWLGQTGTLIRETGGSAAWFGSKEFTSSLLLSYRSKTHPELVADGRKLTKKDLLLWESALSGASAGILYNFVLFPADTVKSTIQTEEELRPRARGAPRPTFFGTLNQLYVKQGLKGLYAGCGITITRSVPSSALIFLIYDGLSKRFP